MYGRTVDSVFAANSHPINDIGNLVVSNMTMEVGGNSGELKAKNGSASTIRFCGGSRWIWFGTSAQGGIVLDRSTLGVYGEKAVPSQAGAGIVSITNGCVLFGRVVESASLPAFTTLKGTAGALDLANAGGSWTVANVEGSPTVTNGSLTVTGAWRVNAAAIGNPATIDGTLAFGPDAEVVVSGDLDSAPHPGGILLANASAIAGTPRIVNADGWMVTTTGGNLRILSNKPTMLIIR